jgi:uncharacterized protein YggE
MEGLVNEGVNKIDNVVFSLQNAHQSEARKLAMKDAKLKDYVSVLGQK